MFLEVIQVSCANAGGELFPALERYEIVAPPYVFLVDEDVGNRPLASLFLKVTLDRGAVIGQVELLDVYLAFKWEKSESKMPFAFLQYGQ